MSAIKHGTHTGYRQHQRRGHRGVQICDECREAWRTYCTTWARENYDASKRRARYQAAKARGYYDRRSA